MINWIYFPKSKKLPEHLTNVISVFENHSNKIDSTKNDTNESRLKSNDVLKVIEKDLQGLGFFVEQGKKKSQKIRRPVLYGQNGTEELSFEADGYNNETKTVIEVEAGRAVINYQFLKDIFQASMMIDTDYLVLAVRNSYKSNYDFQKINKFLEVTYLTSRITFDLKGILLVGY